MFKNKKRTEKLQEQLEMERVNFLIRSHIASVNRETEIYEGQYPSGYVVFPGTDEVHPLYETDPLKVTSDMQLFRAEF